MNLIDRYIAEVGKHLPRRQRTDIEAEIRSTLEDMLEERTQGKGLADEVTVVALLQEYGSPRDVAAKYKTHQYLIGPRLFPIFETVIRIVFAVVAGASLIGLGVGLAKSGLTGPAFVSTLGEWLGGLLSGLIAAFGNVTLVFAIIERTKAANEFEKEFREWDPRDLQQEHDPDQIDRPDHIATLIFTFLGLVVLNLYPNLLAIRYASDGTWVTLPILTETFFRFLPWINIMGLLQISFSAYMLGQRDWKPVTRILDILLDVAGMVLAVLILRTSGIFAITPDALRSIGMGEGADVLSRLLRVVPNIIVIVIIVVTAANVIKSLLRLFAGKSSSPYAAVK